MCSAVPFSTPRMLNIGCGGCFHPDWVNMDMASQSAQVWPYDVRAGIPFADATFDIVYHSHVLEHLTPEWGQRLLRECFRVLRPGGVLRLAVPDLENITRAYLHELDAAEQGIDGADERHAWMLTELVDQLARTHSGGTMLDWWRKTPVPQQAFICQRLGAEAEQGIAAAQRMGERAREKTLLPWEDAHFSQSGELHRWMYDRHSLRRALEECGFTDVQRQQHNTSSTPELLTYGLDGAADGPPRKPDSLFMEARKPQVSVALPSLRVVLLSTSDAGGAGIAACRLHTFLRQHDVTSELYVAQQRLFQEGVHILPVRTATMQTNAASGVALQNSFVQQQRNGTRRLAAYPRPAGGESFSVLGSCCTLGEIPFFKDFDVVHIHWTANMCDPSCDVASLKGRPVFWTLHDMNPFTGGCHYSNGCRKFEKACGTCPQSYTPGKSKRLKRGGCLKAATTASFVPDGYLLFVDSGYNDV